jgi:hypothetical protein
MRRVRSRVGAEHADTHERRSTGRAPARVAKTKAELMLGRWQLIQSNDHVIAKPSLFLKEFFSDGKFHSLATTKKGSHVTNGTYKVVGDTFECHTLSDSIGKENLWTIKIITVSDTEATVVQISENEKWLWQLKRLPSK